MPGHITTIVGYRTKSAERLPKTWSRSVTATLSRRARGTHALTLVLPRWGQDEKTPRPGALAVACQMSCSTAPRDTEFPTRARTLDLAVNSRSLYQLSYRGSGNSILIRPTAPDKYSPHAPDRSARKPQRDAEERGGNNRATQPAQIAPLRSTSVHPRLPLPFPRLALAEPVAHTAVPASFSPPGTGRASGTHGGPLPFLLPPGTGRTCGTRGATGRQGRAGL